MKKLRLWLLYGLVYHGLLIGWTLFAVGLGFAFAGQRLLAIACFAHVVGIGGFVYGLSLGRANAGRE